MSRKKLFIYLWALLIVAGQPLAAVVLFSRNSLAGFLEFLGNLRWSYLIPVIIRKEVVLPDGYETVLFPNPIFFYLVFAYTLMGRSVYRWIKTPSLKAWLWTVFFGWILCGFPGWCLIPFIHFIFLNTN